MYNNIYHWQAQGGYTHDAAEAYDSLTSLQTSTQHGFASLLWSYCQCLIYHLDQGKIIQVNNWHGINVTKNMWCTCDQVCLLAPCGCLSYPFITCLLKVRTIVPWNFPFHCHKMSYLRNGVYLHCHKIDATPTLLPPTHTQWEQMLKVWAALDSQTSYGNRMR